MALKIVHKRSIAATGGVSDAPLPADLDYGEIGINYVDADPTLYIKDSANTVVRVGGAGTEPDATETVKGVAEIATQAEVTAGADDARIVTPLKLAAAVPAATEALAGKAEIATQAEVTTGTDDTRIVTPLKLATAVPAASETVAGKAELATQAEVTAGTDTTRIVTPATAKATFVNLAGDTMTGKLTLSGAPTSNLEAATKLYVDNRGGPGTVGAIAWMNTSGTGAGTGYGATVAKEANGAYRYTFDTALSNTNYAVIAQVQVESFETTRVRNKTVNGFTVSTAWVKTNAGGGGDLLYSDTDHSVAVFNALIP